MIYPATKFQKNVGLAFGACDIGILSAGIER